MPDAEFKIDTEAFVAGFRSRLHEMREQDAPDYLEQAGDAVLQIAESKVKRRSGAVAAGLGMNMGEDPDGPYVAIGVLNPPKDRHDFFLEFGTYKDRAQPFMRPALSMVGGAVRGVGGRIKRKASVSARGISLRANKRAEIRRARKKGVLSAREAGALSFAVSKTFRLRRTSGYGVYIQRTRIRGVERETNL